MLGLDCTDWRSYCLLPFISTVDVNMRWFQYKLLHRILYMKDFLFKLKLTEDNYCTFCKNEEETVTHVFCNCQFITRIWSRFERWIEDKTGEHIVLTDQHKLFGFKGSNNSALNCILIIIRQKIYSAKLRNILPSFSLIEVSIKDYYKKEHFIACINNCKVTEFLNKWSLFHDNIH